MDNPHMMLKQQSHLRLKSLSRIDGQGSRDQPSLATNRLTSNSSGGSATADTDVPDADELELSSLPLIQRDEFIEKVIHGNDKKQMLIPSPLVLACMATCADRVDYEEVVKMLLDSHLVEYDGLNHECVLNRVLDCMHNKDYASFQHVQVYRDTEVEGPSALIFYQFDGFIVNQEVAPLSSALSGSSATLNTSRNEESAGSDDGHHTDGPISVRCFLTVLVLRDIFLQYPRWDFHLLRENIEENFSELENALGCRPTVLYPDGDVISSRKRSDVTWEVIVKYRLSSETGQSLYMQVEYHFFESFGDPFADALANTYQTPFYISCLTDSHAMMEMIFDSYFKRRNLHCWGTVAERHLEHCFGKRKVRRRIESDKNLRWFRWSAADQEQLHHFSLALHHLESLLSSGRRSICRRELRNDPADIRPCFCLVCSTECENWVGLPYQKSCLDLLRFLSNETKWYST